MGTAIVAVLQSWGARTLSTDPIDFDAVVPAIGAVYDIRGLRPPQIIRVENPFEAACAAAQAPDRGTLVAAELRNELAAVVETIFDGTAFLDCVRRPALNGFGIIEDIARIAGGTQAERRAGQLCDRLRSLDAVFREALFGELSSFQMTRRLTPGAFMDGLWRPQVPILIDLARLVGRGDHIDHFKPIADLAWVAGHVLAFHDVCWVSERPCAVRFNDENQLHADGEPAMGFSGDEHGNVYAWRGSLLPDDAMIPLDQLTTDVIDGYPDGFVTEMLIERYGIERYLRDSRARVVNRDGTGRLWVKRQGRRKERWCVVEVVNGTPEPGGKFRRFFLSVPPDTQTPREGVAWTYGMTAEEYEVAVRT